jgi:hypothetical protein
MSKEQNPAPVPISILRTLSRLAVILVIVIVVHLLLNWLLDLSHRTQTRNVMFGVIFVMLLAYVILIAIPFVPGIEIGLSLIFMRGDDVVVLVYVATILGLMLAFLAGRYTKYSYLRRVFLDLRLTKASELLEKVQPLSRQRRLELLRGRLPAFLRPFLVDYRYLAVAVLINIPGNALIGGGGGILMVAGLSRLFSIPAMLITLMLAVSPVPLMVLLFDFELMP